VVIKYCPECGDDYHPGVTYYGFQVEDLLECPYCASFGIESKLEEVNVVS